MKSVLFALFMATLGCLSLPALASELPSSRDLQAEAELAERKGTPLIVLYSRRDCKYCETVRRDYLLPLTTQARYRDRVIVRQINQDSDAALNDFRGAPTTQARLASSEKIKLVPVVAFYGKNGRRLADPIVGAKLADFYQSYLDDAIERSNAMLKTR